MDEYARRVSQPAARAVATTADHQFLKVVLDLIKDHNGNRPITGAQLAKRFGLTNDRIIRLAIRELIAQGHPIASSVHSPYGYFYCSTCAEAERYLATLRSRAIQNFERHRDFARATQRAFNLPVEQLRLEM